MTWWLRWKITRSRDHRIRTCQGCGVAYCTHTLSTLFEVVSASKRSHNRVEFCTWDMYGYRTIVIMDDVPATSGLFLQGFLDMM
jgi:hypothetical protein